MLLYNLLSGKLVLILSNSMIMKGNKFQTCLLNTGKTNFFYLFISIFPNTTDMNSTTNKLNCTANSNLIFQPKHSLQQSSNNKTSAPSLTSSHQNQYRWMIQKKKRQYKSTFSFLEILPNIMNNSNNNNNNNNIPIHHPIFHVHIQVEEEKKENKWK